MPILGTERKTYTDFVKGVSTFENEVAADYNFARVGVKGSTAIEPLGIPLVWNNTDSAFKCMSLNPSQLKIQAFLTVHQCASL
jgi:hypothetical protein